MTLDGVFSANVNILFKKAFVKHDNSVIRARKIIDEIRKCGNYTAEYEVDNNTMDIKEITKAEVDKYR